MTTALSRANRTRLVAMASAWREVASHLASAVEVCREIEADDANGDTALAKVVRAELLAELAKVENRLGALPTSRPPQTSLSEQVDDEHVERVKAARAETEEAA